MTSGLHYQDLEAKLSEHGLLPNPSPVRQLREKAGLSIGQAAKKAGLSRRSWSSIELGQNYPRLCSLEVMADVLNAPLGELAEDIVKWTNENNPARRKWKRR